MFEEFTRHQFTVEELVTRVKPALERMKLEHPGVEFTFRPMVVVPGAEHQWVVADVDFVHVTFVGVRGKYELESLQQLMKVREQLGLHVDHLETMYIIQIGNRRD
jgi:ribosomal silencing factor RsfS